jgi:hypothetical protein
MICQQDCVPFPVYNFSAVVHTRNSLEVIISLIVQHPLYALHFNDQDVLANESTVYTHHYEVSIIALVWKYQYDSFAFRMK